MRLRISTWAVCNYDTHLAGSTESQQVRLGIQHEAGIPITDQREDPTKETSSHHAYMLEGPEPARGETADCPCDNRCKGTPRTSRTGADPRRG